jgi:LmbE family N-acetylglucosaminyl deacetylase
MRVLVVAHPDDEVLWFAAEIYDSIVVAFLGRTDKPEQTEGRRKAMADHPLADRIVCVGLTESNFWRDKSRAAEHVANRARLVAWLRENSTNWDSVDTHNAWGEYQHADHILVHGACMEALDCSVNGQDPDIYRRARAAYEKHNCWTWY